MYCEHCGKQIDDDSHFCIFCGGKVIPRIEDPRSPVEKHRNLSAGKKPLSKGNKIAIGFLITLFAVLVIGIIVTTQLSSYENETIQDNSTPSQTYDIPAGTDGKDTDIPNDVDPEESESILPSDIHYGMWDNEIWNGEAIETAFFSFQPPDSWRGRISLREYIEYDELAESFVYSFRVNDPNFDEIAEVYVPPLIDIYVFDNELDVDEGNYYYSSQKTTLYDSKGGDYYVYLHTFDENTYQRMDDEVDYFLEELPSNPQYLELAQDIKTALEHLDFHDGFSPGSTGFAATMIP